MLFCNNADVGGNPGAGRQVFPCRWFGGRPLLDFPMLGCVQIGACGEPELAHFQRFTDALRKKDLTNIYPIPIVTTVRKNGYFAGVCRPGSI
jgi:hypothetical protein